MLHAFKRLWNDKRGNALILMGAALPLLVGAAGLATDTIEWTLWKRQLQRAADSGAIAGVYTRLRTDTQDAVSGAVNTDLDLNNHVGIAFKTGFPQIERLGDDGVMKNRVKVSLEVTHSLPFSSMFMAASPTIRAVATAAGVPGDEYCVIALDPSVAIVGLEIAGSSDLDLGECSLIANSTNPIKAASNGASSATGGKGSTVKAKSIAAAGGVQYSSTWAVTDYDPNSPPVVDPFGPTGQQPLPNPKIEDCTPGKTISIAKKDFPMDRTTGGSADTSGQTVCISGGLNVQGDLKLQSGVTYIVDAGDLVMNSTGSSLSCTGCTIILTNFSDPTATGNINLTGGTLNLTAPTTDGTYKGIALYQDRRAADDGKVGQNQINGNSGAAVTGVIYTPGRSLLYNGGGNLTAVCMQVVGKRITFSGSSKIKIGSACGPSGLGALGGGVRVRLVA